MHAEQNALISAARFGNAVERAVIYSTMRPCFDYTKAALQAKIQAIHYPDNWEYPIRTSGAVRANPESVSGRSTPGIAARNGS